MGTAKSRCKLNADWVEALMDVPAMWTDCGLLGNGVYPATAAKAFVTLFRRFL
jgi:hypothetical protein